MGDEVCRYNADTKKCSRKAFPHMKERCELSSKNRCVLKKTRKLSKSPEVVDDDAGEVVKRRRKIITKKKLGVLIVQNKKKQTTGIITDGQIRRFNQKNPNLHATKVSKVMTKNPVSVEKNDLAAKALSIMNNKKITSLCVFDKKNKSKTIGVLHVHTILQSNIY